MLICGRRMAQGSVVPHCRCFNVPQIQPGGWKPGVIFVRPDGWKRHQPTFPPIVSYLRVGEWGWCRKLIAEAMSAPNKDSHPKKPSLPAPAFSSLRPTGG